METKEEEWLRFIDTLSHELKTPLTTIIAAAGLLADELQNSTDESCQKLIQTITHNANTLEKRLAELLDTVKTGAGRIQLHFAPVDMKSLVLGSCLQISPLLRSKAQNLKTDFPDSIPIISGDGPRLEQVLLNLMTNATKFTPEGGNILIRVRNGDGNLEVDVQDDGIGIAEDLHENIFKPYNRLNADRQRHPGLGLGLALAKQVVELHGGRIWVKSRPGQGSTFSFSLPQHAGHKAETGGEV